MRQGWVKKRLSEVTTKIGSGATPRGGDESYKTEGISLIRSLNVYDDGFREAKLARIDEGQANALSNVVVEPQDVLLNITGASVARCCRAPAELLPARVNQHVSIIRPVQERLDSDFLHYLLISKDYKNRLLSTGEEGGSTRQAITKAQLQDFVVEFPDSLPEQQRIVALLDEAFAGLATAKANAERNLQNARAIFESHLQAVFTQRGEGWVESTIGETCILKSGTTVSATLEQPDGDLPYLKVADMSFEGNEDQITSSSRFLLMADVKESAVIPKGATLFPKRGGAIMTNKKRIAALPICADLNIMSVIPSQRLRAQLLYYYFLNVDMRKLGSGSSIPQINNYDVEPLTISFPESLATQEELIRAFDELRKETQRLTRLYERKLAALEELKKSLLHQAFNGEL
jgi:type I restriction enzyme S subunit